jgi:hypothetical protein
MAAVMVASTVTYMIEFAVYIIVCAGLWKMFLKAGKPGWAAIIPVYNGIVMLEIIEKPIWWIVLCFIPIVNIVIGVMIVLELAKVYGQSAGFAVGMILLPFIFYPILGFGDATYTPPGGVSRPVYSQV